MANTVQATKRAEQSKLRAEHNGAGRSKLRTAIKKIRNEIQVSKENITPEAFKVAVSAIDKSVTKGLIHKNKAARLKSRLNRSIKLKASNSR